MESASTAVAEAGPHSGRGPEGMPSEQVTFHGPTHNHGDADEHEIPAETSDRASAEHAPCAVGSEHMEHGLVDGAGQQMSLGEDRYPVDRLRATLQMISLI